MREKKEEKKKCSDHSTWLYTRTSEMINYEIQYYSLVSLQAGNGKYISMVVVAIIDAQIVTRGFKEYLFPSNCTPKNVFHPFPLLSVIERRCFF